MTPITTKGLLQTVLLNQSIDKHQQHGRIQKIPPGGFIVIFYISISQQRISHRDHTILPREAIEPRGSISFSMRGGEAYQYF